MELQYINDKDGNRMYVLLPVEEYKQLFEKLMTYQNENDDEENWMDIPVEKGDNDDITNPHEVVTIVLEQSVSLLAAWRIHRGLSQAKVAKQLGISQSALSQIEKSEKPQRKTCERLAKIYNCLPEQLYL